MKIILKVLFCFFIVSHILIVIGYSQEILSYKKKLADSVWSTMPKWYFPDQHIIFEIENKEVLSLDDKRRLEDLYFRQNYSYEMYCVQLRSWGINFWKRFSIDNRRFDWLIKTLENNPHYFKKIEQGIEDEKEKQYNAVFDFTELAKWQKTYKVFRGEYLRSPTQIEGNEKYLIYLELIKQWDDQKWVAIRKVNPLDYKNWSMNVINYSKWCYANPDKCMGMTQLIGSKDMLQSNFIYGIVDQARQHDLTLATQLEILEYFIHSGIYRFKEMAEHQKTFLKLYTNPIDFCATTTDGQVIDLKTLKGKVVLMDFWDVNCTSCIHMMPELKEIYDRYKDSGFVVISICSDAPERIQYAKKKAAEINQRIYADWPFIFLDSAEVLINKYSFTVLANVLLLDRNGMLIGYNEKLLKPGELESEIKKAISN